MTPKFSQPLYRDNQFTIKIDAHNIFNMADHNELGKQGEEIATSYLRKKGYIILARNYRFKRQEIDIIARYNGLLIVVEVKTRNSNFLAGPEVTVTRNKQRSIVRVTADYIQVHKSEMDTRFDIISIIHNGKYTKVEHLEDAFYPTL